MIVHNEERTRELLIDSRHSSSSAAQYFLSRLSDAELLRLLVLIAKDEDDHGGDAPMEAAHWMSEFPADLLVPHEGDLMAMLPRVDGYGGAVAVALGKIRSKAGKSLIERELGNGERFDAWLFRKALSFYESE